jgi:hypothetical protein
VILIGRQCQLIGLESLIKAGISAEKRLTMSVRGSPCHRMGFSSGKAEIMKRLICENARFPE